MDGILKSSSRGGILHTLAAVLGRIGAGSDRAAANRRVLHRLSRMSDRELRDIGLVRQDVHDASLPGLDAISLLRDRRDEAWRFSRPVA